MGGAWRRRRKFALIGLQTRDDLIGFICREPASLGWMITYEEHPHDRPHNRGQALEEERALPAEAVDEETGYGGHPQNCDGVAKHEEDVGARAVRAREPSREDQQKRGEDDALGDTQTKTIDCEHPELAQDTGERGKRAPDEERYRDQSRAAEPACSNHSRNLKEEITEKKQGAEKRVLAARNPE